MQQKIQQYPCVKTKLWRIGWQRTTETQEYCKKLVSKHAMSYASAAVDLNSSLFWVITQHRLVKHQRPIFKSQVSKEKRNSPPTDDYDRQHQDREKPTMLIV